MRDLQRENYESMKEGEIIFPLLTSEGGWPEEMRKEVNTSVDEREIAAPQMDPNDER